MSVSKQGGKTNAERQAEYRARRKAEAEAMRKKGKKKVTLWLDARLVDAVRNSSDNPDTVMQLLAEWIEERWKASKKRKTKRRKRNV